MSEVRIWIDGVMACWDGEGGGWTRLADPLAPSFADLAPQLDEWETFWSAKAACEPVIDVRDLGFDGEGARNADWRFRSRRWRLLHGDEPPTPGATPSGYSVHRFDDGWVLQDDVLNRPALLIAGRR